MLLKVGDLAKSTGLTVRTLHHYDSIGLLKPSARSEAGYRLYNAADVALLHAIQALRHLGLPLADIGAMLEGGGEGLPGTIARQIRALDHEIMQANELRARLQLLQSRLATGNAPDMADWLSTLLLMNTFSKYFSAAELKSILENRKTQSAAWDQAIADARRAMHEQCPADSPRMQALALRWMNLTLAMMNDDFNLIDRWGQMYSTEPTEQFKNGPGREVVNFVKAAITLRVAAMLRHMSMAELRTLRTVSDDAVQRVKAQAHVLIAQNMEPDSAAAQALIADWLALMDTISGHNPALLRKVIDAHRQEPLLQGTTIFDAPTLDYIQQALIAQKHPFAVALPARSTTAFCHVADRPGALPNL